ncbi:MAG: DUF504 domain-containing protein [Euryarchaeota archaeon]|nr:DUF504 domain-containing protein [Euryarchaeota archaeon]
MAFPRDILNELKWRHDRLSDASIAYLHRGAPGDRRIISGSAITDLGRSFFKTAESKIPYHRIRLIMLDDEVIYRDRGEKVED